MSKRNGPTARASASLVDRPRSGSSDGPVGGTAQRFGRAEYTKALALQEEVSRADGDYQRLRAAYLELARNEPTHEVGLAMIGADMNRAHARLQALIGLPRLPFTHEPGAVMLREASRPASENP